jgi:hypothetical protein
METIKKILENGPEWIGAIDLLIVGLIAVCALIPGDQPEKALRAIAAVIGKFSRKPKV